MPLIGTGPDEVPVNGLLGTMAHQDSKAVNITGGKINEVPIGVDTPSTGGFTALIAATLNAKDVPTLLAEVAALLLSQASQDTAITANGAAIDVLELAAPTTGTWTPTYSPASGSVTSAGTGAWTKIGKLWICTFNMNTTALSAPSGNLQIAGLPGNPSSNPRNNGVGAVFCYDWANATFPVAIAPQNGSTCELWYPATTGHSRVQGSAMAAGISNTMRGGFCFYED